MTRVVIGWFILALTIGLAAQAPRPPAPTALRVEPPGRLSWDPRRPTLTWLQDAPDIITAQQQLYRVWVDGVLSRAPIAPMVFTGTRSPFTVSMAVPEMPAGAHQVAVHTEIWQQGVRVASALSDPVQVGGPAAPLNLRIVK